jgi:hypothetical protein
MKPVNYKNSIRIVRKTLVVLAIFGLTQYVFAVDGTLNGGGNSKAKNTTFSNIKKDLNISLRSGYNFKNNKSFGFQKSGKTSMFNSMVIYQKGNVTYFFPSRNKPLLQKFKTPSAPVIR